MKHTYIAASDKLILRPLDEGDIESLRVWRAQKHNYQYLTHLGEITPEQQKQWFYRYLDNPNQIIWAITEADSGKLLGSVSIYDIDREKGVAEFGGIMLGDMSARGKGYGYEASRLCTKMGFEDIGLSRIIGTVNTQNIAAICIYSRLGYVFTGVQPFSGGVDGTDFTFGMEKQRFERLCDTL
ncbi:MAG: GNAT family N-acetyltransferase [Clostridia bacterium]|nr:GNAT family N-acetyltransferase [Clostridia bacterium]